MYYILRGPRKRGVRFENNNLEGRSKPRLAGLQRPRPVRMITSRIKRRPWYYCLVDGWPNPLDPLLYSAPQCVEIAPESSTCCWVLETTNIGDKNGSAPTCFVYKIIDRPLCLKTSTPLCCMGVNDALNPPVHLPQCRWEHALN